MMIVMMIVAKKKAAQCCFYDDERRGGLAAQCTLEWPFRAAVQGDKTEAFFMSYLSPSQINS